MQLSTDRLFRRMEIEQVTAAQLAEKAGISRQAMYNIMNGKSQPRPDTLRAICDALGCTAQSLQGLEGGSFDHRCFADTIVERASREGHSYDVKAAIVDYIKNQLASTYSDLDREMYAEAQKVAADYGDDLGSSVAMMMKCFADLCISKDTQKKAVAEALVATRETLTSLIDCEIGVDGDGVDIFDGVNDDQLEAEAQPRKFYVDQNPTSTEPREFPVPLNPTSMEEIAEHFNSKRTDSHTVYSFKAPKRD